MPDRFSQPVRHGRCFLLAWLLAFSAMASVDAQDDTSVLPYSGTDVVVVRTPGGSTELLGGTIVDITGNRVTLRRNGRGDIRIVRLNNVSELRFHRGKAWQDGLELYHQKKYAQALVKFDFALDSEIRRWAWCELQAIAAKTLTRLRNYRKAVRRVELIEQKDPETRHLAALPLVWDAELPDDERLTMAATEMRSAYKSARLAAASAFLHDHSMQPAAIEVLQRIVTEEGLTVAGELARCQLWRLHELTKPRERNPVLKVWADRVREMPKDLRYGPQYVVARGFWKHHDYDRAALGFLWTPLMSDHDEPLAAKSLVLAITCLQAAGRPNEARQLVTELKQRYPQTSACRHFLAQQSQPDLPD